MYEERVALAAELHKQGHNCCQSVVAAFGDLYGFTREQCLKMSAAYGGGIGRMKETCGAALGLFMLAGRKSFAVTKRKSESWAFWEYCSRFLPLRSSQVFISWMPESPARCCSSILSWSQ